MEQQGIYRKTYQVINSFMDPEFRLTTEGITFISQDTFARMMTIHRCAAFDLRGKNLMWIITDFTFRVVGQLPFWVEELEVESWLSEPAGIKLYQEYRLSYKGKVFAYGDCSWAMLNTEDRRPINTASMVQGLHTLPEMTLGSHRHKFPVSTDHYMTVSHVTDANDKDFNYHVTNITYARLCMNAMPLEYTLQHDMTEFSIRFEHETFVGQELLCSIESCDQPDTYLYNISTKDEPDKIVCRAYAQYGEKSKHTVAERLQNIRELAER